MEILDLKKLKNPDVLDRALEVLKAGGLVVYPTETMYGLGADVTNQDAIDKLLQYKARREGKPLSASVASLEMAKKYANINQLALNLFKNFLPGPITVVCYGLHKVVSGVESEQGTLGLRLPDYPLVTKIIQFFGKPITATSANAANQKRPYKITDIFEPLSKKQKKLIDLVLDAGELPHREPSTIVDTTMDDYQILRQGEIGQDQLQSPAIQTQSDQDTINYGQKLINKYLSDLKENCLIFALVGDLGTGKTQLTKGIARGLKIKELIVSPTFNLVREYDYQLDNQKGRLYHIDTWRMFDPDELEQIGLPKMIKPGNVIIIEWADKVENNKFQIPNVKLVEIKLEHISQNERQISLSSLPSLSS